METIEKYLRIHKNMFVRLDPNKFKMLHKKFRYEEGDNLLKICILDYHPDEVMTAFLKKKNVKRNLAYDWDTRYLVINILSDEEVNKLTGLLASGFSFHDYIEIKMKQMGY